MDHHTPTEGSELSHRPGSLVATLGTAPQVVTLVLDALMAMGERLARVCVLHTDPSLPAIGDAISTLRLEFERYPAYRGILFAPEPFMLDGIAIPDVTTPQEARAVLQTIYTQLSTLKSSGERIHLCAAGGRKAMAMYAMLVAQLLFGEDDRLWMLVSPDGLRLERRLHTFSQEALLLRVPVLPWRLSLSDKQAFIQRELTFAEREVLELAARGLSTREIASRRNTSIKTAEVQLSKIYSKLRVFLGYREDVHIDRHVLVAEFSAYLDIMDALSLR